MIDNQESHSVARMMLFLLGYVLVFVAVSAVLIWLFPAYTVWIVVATGYLFVALAAFKIGLEWTLAGTPSEGRRAAKLFPIIFLGIGLGKLFSDLVRNRQPNWMVFVIYIGFFAAAIYPPFYLGRLIARHRTST